MAFSWNNRRGNDFDLQLPASPSDLYRDVLKDDVSIPGYVNEFRNGDEIRGGGVGACIKESIKKKQRKDIFMS